MTFVKAQTVSTHTGLTVDRAPPLSQVEALRRSNRAAGTFSAAEALRWLTQGKGLSQNEAQGALSGLQKTHHISVVRQPDVDLGTCLQHDDLSPVQLQLVTAAPQPKFGQPLNMHYNW